MKAFRVEMIVGGYELVEREFALYGLPHLAEGWMRTPVEAQNRFLRDKAKHAANAAQSLYFAEVELDCARRWVGEHPVSIVAPLPVV